jgi:hypothetical protein
MYRLKEVTKQAQKMKLKANEVNTGEIDMLLLQDSIAAIGTASS